LEHFFLSVKAILTPETRLMVGFLLTVAQTPQPRRPAGRFRSVNALRANLLKRTADCTVAVPVTAAAVRPLQHLTRRSGAKRDQGSAGLALHPAVAEGRRMRSGGQK
jgi:hypothetical protein